MAGHPSACGPIVRRAVGRWLPALLALFALPALAAPQPAIELSQEVIDVAPYLDVLEDRDGLLGVAQARAAERAGSFRPLAASAASFGLTDAAWWLKFRLHNAGPTARTAVLRQSYPMLDRIEVWVWAEGRLVQHWQTGDRLPFASRPIAHRDFLFPLQLATGETQTVLIRAQSEGPVNVPLTLYTPVALFDRVAIEQLALGALFGSILLLATSILVLFLFVRDASFLHYLFYLLCYGGYMAAFNGIAYQYVLPDAPDLAALLQVLLLMAALWFLLQFARSILQTAVAAPRIDRTARLLQWLLVAIAAASPWLSYATLITPISVAVVAAILLVMAMGVAADRAGQPTARWFMLAWSAFLLGVLVYMLKSFGLLAHGFVTQYGFQIGTILEFILLSLALGVRVQEIKRQSRTDSLTGLGNRARFDELIDQQFASCAAANAPLSLLIIDIDLFKQVNDDHGHAIGDRVLQRVAAYVRRTPRQAALAFRYGGEEFAVLLPRTALDIAARLAEQLRAEVAADAHPPRVTISVGVACSSQGDCPAPRDLFRAADEALYAAKRRGRNCVVADRPDARHRRITDLAAPA